MQSSVYEKDGVRRTSWQVRGSDYRLLDRAAAVISAPDPVEEPDAGDDVPL